MVVAVNFHRGEYDNGEGVFSVSFCRDDVQRVLVLFGAVPVGRRVLKAGFRLVRDAVRYRGEHVGSVCLICLFEDRCACDPYRYFSFRGLSRHVALVLHRLLKVVRRFVLGVCEWGGDYYVCESYRASPTHLVAANLCRVFVRVEWWRDSSLLLLTGVFFWGEGGDIFLREGSLFLRGCT